MPIDRRLLLTRWLPALGLAPTLLHGRRAEAAEPPPAEPLRLRPLVEGLEHPWAMAFLPDFDTSGRILVTERPGRMRLAHRDGTLSAPLAGVPNVFARGQGGLLDVALHPRFADNSLVYWSYAEPSGNGERGNSTAVARGRLDVPGNALADVKVIWRQAPRFESTAHFGSRLVFARDGHLFVTLGDRYYRRDDAHTFDTHHGKIVRITDEGGVPADNPFVKQRGALPEIWSYGHRNVQGAALHPTTGELWAHEHGPQGGDELNIVRAGADHGWPVITYGREYMTNAVIGAGTARAGIVAPLMHWIPSIGPSGMAFVNGERHAAWRGQLLVGALRARELVRLELDGNRVLREHRHTVDARVRDVRQAPDGHLYLLTDEAKGRILRIEA